MNLKGTVSSLPDSTGNLFVQMGILRSKVNIRDIELIREDDINATLGDGSSAPTVLFPEQEPVNPRRLFHRQKVLIPAQDDQDVKILLCLTRSQSYRHDYR